MSSTLSAGARLCNGKYVIEKALGQGSFGVTYRATTQMQMAGDLGSLSAKVTVAVKEFFMSEMNNRGSNGSVVEGSEVSMVLNYRRKFRKEAENLSHLNHPNIVKVLSVFDENNTSYYVMEYLDGTNLDDRIVKRGKLAEGESISIIRKIGSALQYMHDHKMLHLDMKPGNIMCTNDGRVVLIDFGLSKQYDDNGEPESSTTLGLGTKGYAPIEQADYRQDGTFPATLDVYALGATLFKMLTGQRPMAASELMNDEEFIGRTLSQSGVSPETVAVVCKAMAFRRKDRYQTVKEFMAALPAVRDESDDEGTDIERPGEAKNTPTKQTGQPTRSQEPRQKPVSKQSKEQTGGSTSYAREGESGKKPMAWLWVLIGVLVVGGLVVLFSTGGSISDGGSDEQILRVRDMKTALGTWSGRVSVDDLGDSIPDGHGELRYFTSDKDGRSSYNGGMKMGKRDGKGILIYKSGVIFDGVFAGDKFKEGVFKDPAQQAYYKGTFQNDRPWTGSWYYISNDKKFAVISEGEAIPL